MAPLKQQKQKNQEMWKENLTTEKSRKGGCSQDERKRYWFVINKFWYNRIKLRKIMQIVLFKLSENETKVLHAWRYSVLEFLKHPSWRKYLLPTLHTVPCTINFIVPFAYMIPVSRKNEVIVQHGSEDTSK